jgi:hypothetical protein
LLLLLSSKPSIAIAESPEVDEDACVIPVEQRRLLIEFVVAEVPNKRCLIDEDNEPEKDDEQLHEEDELDEELHEEAEDWLDEEDELVTLVVMDLRFII